MISFSELATKPFACVALGAALLAGCGAAGDDDSTEAEGAVDLAEETAGQTSEALRSKCGPEVDPTLAVPSGNKLAFSLDAVGVQIYACQATATGFSWVFQAPEADLLNARGRVVGTHYAGPTWESKDGSTVKGTKLAGFTADASTIPWLLLQASSQTGDGRMSEVSYIQRLETSGGLAPAAGCDGDHVGAIARSDYAATYYFYKAARRGCD